MNGPECTVLRIILHFVEIQGVVEFAARCMGGGKHLLFEELRDEIIVQEGPEGSDRPDGEHPAVDDFHLLRRLVKAHLDLGDACAETREVGQPDLQIARKPCRDQCLQGRVQHRKRPGSDPDDHGPLLVGMIGQPPPDRDLVRQGQAVTNRLTVEPRLPGGALHLRKTQRGCRRRVGDLLPVHVVESQIFDALRQLASKPLHCVEIDDVAPRLQGEGDTDAFLFFGRRVFLRDVPGKFEEHLVIPRDFAPVRPDPEGQEAQQVPFFRSVGVEVLSQAAEHGRLDFQHAEIPGHAVQPGNQAVHGVVVRDLLHEFAKGEPPGRVPFLLTRSILIDEVDEGTLLFLLNETFGLGVSDEKGDGPPGHRSIVLFEIQVGFLGREDAQQGRSVPLPVFGRHVHSFAGTHVSPVT